MSSADSFGSTNGADAKTGPWPGPSSNPGCPSGIAIGSGRKGQRWNRLQFNSLEGSGKALLTVSQIFEAAATSERKRSGQLHVSVEWCPETVDEARHQWKCAHAQVETETEGEPAEKKGRIDERLPYGALLGGKMRRPTGGRSPRLARRINPQIFNIVLRRGKGRPGQAPGPAPARLYAGGVAGVRSLPPIKAKMPPIAARAMKMATMVPPRIAPPIAHRMRSTPKVRPFATIVTAPRTMVRNEKTMPPHPKPMMVSAPSASDAAPSPPVNSVKPAASATPGSGSPT